MVERFVFSKVYLVYSCTRVSQSMTGVMRDSLISPLIRLFYAGRAKQLHS
jgi:hypothetical protein